MKKLVLTGAAGRLGSYLREPLTALCDTLVSTDIVDDLGELYPGETYIKADLAKMDQIAPVLDGADMVIHFGAIVDEKPFEELLGPNFVGSYNIWEAGYKVGVRRIVYASSIHAVGMHLKSDFIGTDADSVDLQLCLRSKFCQQALIVVRIDNYCYASMVLGRRADHRRAADIDVLDRGRVVRAAGDGRFEGVEIDDQEVDARDAMGLHRREMLGIVPQCQKPAMDLGVKRLHPSIHHFRKTSVCRYVCDVYTSLAYSACCTAR